MAAPTPNIVPTNVLPWSVQSPTVVEPASAAFPFPVTIVDGGASSGATVITALPTLTPGEVEPLSQLQNGELVTTIADPAGNFIDLTAPVPTFAQPSNLAAYGVTPVTTATAASSKLIKTGAGNLYGFEVVTGASAGYVMLFNATTLPANGTVTPFKVFGQVAANATVAVLFNPPIHFTTGMTIGFSTTGPFSLTASATAFISGDAQ